VTVWNRQDWVWRVTAVAGLIYALVAVVDIHAICSLAPCGRPSSFTPEPSWGFDNVVWIGKYSLIVIACWLPMLKWPRGTLPWGGLSWRTLPWGALAWGIVWTGATALVVVSAIADGDVGNIPSIDQWLALLGVGVCCSQIWVAWEAHTASTRPPGSSRFRNPEKGAQVRHRAGPMWLLVAVCGEVALLGCAVLIPVHHLSQDSVIPRDALLASIFNYSGIVITATFALNTVVLFIGMTVSGRGWLWWTMLWTLCLPGFVAALVAVEERFGALGADFPFSSRELEALVGKAGWGMALVLLAISQIWVAVKAREMQRQQGAGTEALEG
jgi:hypothetical protein